MKKVSILSLCLIAGLAASAQKTVLKDAEKAMKGGKPFTEVVTIITPATTNPETDKLAETYFIPGKAGFKQYDDLLGKKQLGMIAADAPEVAAAANALLGGYEWYLKALPLDSLPDEKGKVKPKYSKEIVNTIAGHYSDYSSAGVDFWNAKEYDKAYQSWGIFLALPKTAPFASAIKNPVPDSIQAEIAYNQALAAWQADKLENAISSFKNAINLGYDKKTVYEYGVAVALGAKNNDALLFFAEGGNKHYGNEDTQFLNQIINYYLQTEKYDEAINFLNKGIAENPNNAQYYALAGIIYDNQKNREKALESYKKAIGLDADNPLANFYLGRAIAAQAGALQDEYTGTDYENYKTTNIDPLYKEAVNYLEKAYKLDENNRAQVLQVLEIVYYNLNDEAGMNSIKERKLND